MAKIIFTVLLLTHYTQAAQNRRVANEQEQNFFSTTGLEVADYTLKSGADICLEGGLYTVATDKGFTLMLGSQPLILGLGREKFTVTDRSCKSEISATFEKARVNGLHVETCKRIKRIFKTTIKVEDGGFTYEQEVTENNKPVRHNKCQLLRDLSLQN